MTPLELVQLPALMAVTSGSEDITIALLDGPVVFDHPDLLSERIQDIAWGVSGRCSDASSSACQHGTFVAAILISAQGLGGTGDLPWLQFAGASHFSREDSRGRAAPAGDCPAVGCSDQ